MKLRDFFIAMLFLFTAESCSFNDVFIQSDSEASIIENEVHTKTDWTVMVYMAADNNLSEYSVLDLKEMERAEYNKDAFRLITLCDNKEGTALYDMNSKQKLYSSSLGIGKDSARPIDMGNKTTLMEFIKFCKTYYPAKKYALIMWGHGTGYRFSGAEKIKEKMSRAVAFDDSSGTFIETPVLKKAIAEGMCGEKLELIAFDTCFAAEIEEAYELCECASWFCGSEGTQSFLGLDYAKWFDSSVSECRNGKELSLKAKEQCAPYSENSFSVIQLAYIPGVVRAFDAFCHDAVSFLTTQKDIETLRTSLLTDTLLFSVTGSGENPVYLDIQSLCELVARLHPALKTKADAVFSALRYAVCADGARLPLGVYFCSRDDAQNVILPYSTYYVKGEAVEEQCAFVKESSWYVPTKNNHGTFLDKIWNL